MFDKNKKYKIQYAGAEEELVFTGKIIEENNDFIKIKTIRQETLFLRLEKIIKIQEVLEWNSQE